MQLLQFSGQNWQAKKNRFPRRGRIPSFCGFPVPAVINSPEFPSPSLATSYNIPFRDAIIAIFGAKLASRIKNRFPRRGRVPNFCVFPVPAGINSPEFPSPSLATSYNIPFRDAIVAIFGTKLASQTISIVVSSSASFLLKIARWCT